MTATTTNTVTALRFYRAGDIRIDKIPPRPCGPDEVRLKIAYCGICGSDVHELLAGPIFPPPEGTTNPHTGVTLPVVLGHEFSGTIIQLGNNVTGFQLNQRVTGNPACDHRTYGQELCNQCKQGHFNICDASSNYGLSAPGGGFSDQIVIKATNCIPLPDSVSLRVAALIEPLSVAHHCITSSGFQKGDSILISGAGPIGLALLLILRVMGASTIIITEILGTRMERAHQFGADHIINPIADGATTAETASKIRKLAGGDGVDIAFDAMGLQSTLDLSISSVRPRGTIFNVAIHEKPLSLNLNSLVSKEKTLKAGICYLRQDFDSVIKMLSEGTLDAEKMITSVVPLSKAIDGGFNELVHNREAHVKILVQPDSNTE